MLFSKRATFALGCFCLLFSGQTYSFSDYSQALKDSLKLSDTETEAIQCLLTFGSYFGLPSGLLYDALNRRGGRWGRRWASQCLFAVGIALNSIGYLALWAAATGRIEAAPFWLVCVFAYVAGHGGE